MHKKLTVEQCKEIYEILRINASASPGWVDDFVHHCSTDCEEYRLNSMLGFGGKFRNNHNGIYVDCYPEDMNPEREKVIKTLNSLLKKYN
jgi:hypothetical protein